MNILKKIYHTFTSKGAWILFPTFLIGMFMPITASVQALSNCDIAYSESNFTLGGTATQSSNTILLTPAQGNRFGAIWNKSRVNLSSDFCVTADVYLGNNNAGADGIAFVIQPNSVAAGSNGGGLGYAGINPSFAVEYDTYQNGGELSNDHVALMINGDTSNHSAWGVSAVDVGDIEDGQWRKTKVYWDSALDKVSVWLDRNADGDLDDAGEILFDAVLANIEANFSSEVYWGFTAATGGAVNVQQVRNITYTGVARVNTPPAIATPPTLGGSVVRGVATNIPFVLSDDGTTQAQWSFTKASSNETVVPLSAISVAMSDATNGVITVTASTAGSSNITVTALDADGSSTPMIFTVTATAPSLEVTSLLDDGSSGTLRWAITQANANSGGIYDSIIFGVQGTITLTSDFPAITQGLVITGTGVDTTIIDGDNAYRVISNNGNRTIILQNMTLKQGKNASGGLVSTNYGTFTVDTVKFTANVNSAWFQTNATVTTFTNCTFTYNYSGIGSDYGSYPSGLSLIDTDYQNRIYVYNSLFTNNTYGISTERFVQINNTQFSNNTNAASLRGLSRSQVSSSVFTSNTVGLRFYSLIPTSWTPIANNQMVSGNSFNGNTTAIEFDNRWNNNTYIYNGVRSNAFSTSSGNTFGAITANTANYSGTGYVSSGDIITVETTTTTSTTTTSTLPTPIVQIVVPIEVPSVTTAPSLVVTEPVVIVPTGTTLPPPVTEPTLTTSPVTTLVPTLETDTTLITETTLILLPVIPDGTIAKPTSPNTTVKITETTAVKTTETTVVVPLKVKTVTNDILDTNATSEEVDKALDKVLDSNFTDTQLTQVIDSVFSDITNTQQVTALVADFLEKDLSTKELTTVMEAVFNEDATVGQMSAVVDDLLEQDLSIKELTAVFDAAFDDDLSDKETIDLIVDVLKDGLDAETLGAALGAVFDKEVSTEVLVQTFTAVLGNELNEESIGIIVEVLESNTITAQQVSQVVTLVIQQEGGIPSDQATELATSAKVLESVDGAQATEVFSALVVSQVSSENGLAIVNAIEEAPKEVKESFEEEINIFTGVFDTYTSIGSTVDTGSRRTLIAATTAVATIATAVSTGGGSGGSTGGSGGGSGGSGGTNTEGRSKKEEESEEPAGEIAGPGDDEDSNFTKNSIFKYYTKEGIEMRKFDWLGFAKKLWDITAGLAFTFAGSVVVYYTLSGTTQTIALVSTVTACVVHYTHQILKNDED